MNKDVERVKSLIAKAANANDSVGALQYSQAALNAANALRALTDVPNDD